ncbi:MAG: hypothetical protein HOK57_04295 [Planctomycetaceae bacterium]|nr:hypothetical protein [Planctomycetaceae bacterium]
MSNHPRFDRRRHQPPPDSGGRLFDPPITPDPTDPAIAIAGSVGSGVIGGSNSRPPESGGG